MRAALLFVLVALVACGPLPQPFAPPQTVSAKKRSAALQPPDGVGIVVNPIIEGAPPEISEKLSAAMVKALNDLNVPASTTSRNKRSYALDAQLLRPPAEGKVSLLWTLSDPEGTILGEHTQDESVDMRAWKLALPSAMSVLAAKAAGPVAAFIQETGTAETATALANDVEVRPVEGAPGDGQASLTRALKYYLLKSNVRVSERPNQAASIVQGTVDVGAPRGGTQPVKIVWRVLQPNGSEIGRVDQTNNVPTGTLDGAWSDLAYQIAESAAPGIATLLAKSRTNTPANGRPAAP
ncbi:MAG: hypothetical protein U1F33_06870 [Alphaproteobacteria bacterium]